jgi:hypothetical protein
VSKPHYRPGCQYKACRSAEGQVATATKYFTDVHQTWHVCSGCLLKLAIKYGLAEKPSKKKPTRKPKLLA